MGVERALLTGGLGASVHRHRTARGLSAARLAHEIGVRPSDVGRWERGEDAPPLTRVHALVRALAVDEATASWWVEVAGRHEPEVAVEIVIDLAPPDPFVVISNGGAEPPVRDEVEIPPPAPPRPEDSRPRSPGSMGPVSASVFPDPARPVDRERHVYSASPAPLATAGNLGSGARLLRIALGLAGLGAVLTWAFDQLGEGLGDLVELFRGPAGG